MQANVIRATEHVRATPYVVFSYLTDPALIVTWLGEKADLDPQPGGLFAIGFGDVVAQGTYTAVEPPHRVEFTWGIPGDDTLPAGSTTVEIVLTPDGDGTRVELTHTGLPPAHVEGHRAGWEQRLGRLASR